MAASPQKSRESGSAVASRKKPMDKTALLKVILCALLNLRFNLFSPPEAASGARAERAEQQLVLPVIDNDRTVPLQGARAERAVGHQEIGHAPDCLRGQRESADGPAARRVVAH